MLDKTAVSEAVRQLAEKIEFLAKDVQNKLVSDADVVTVLNTANELVRNNLTFVFALGEFYTVQRAGSDKKVKASVVSNPGGTTPRWHNVRDARGRFAKKP